MPQGIGTQKACLGEVVSFSPPQPLATLPDVELAAFSCGEPSLDSWLKNRARASDGKSARTYVICGEEKVIAYYCLSAGCIRRELAPKRISRNMPDPIPVIVLGRLAVDREFQGRGISSSLMRHCLLQTISASDLIGARALVVNPLNHLVVKYYLDLGFLGIDPTNDTLYMPIETIRRAFG